MGIKDQEMLITIISGMNFNNNIKQCDVNDKEYIIHWFVRVTSRELDIAATF
jgi:hypothetical protein